ncbi:MAG: hypothetical protein ACXAEX_07100 [Promethearchaeota archaeon]|jgi:hypothetical protein
MSENIDLKELEKRAWKSTLIDGIFEIYFGILHLSLTLGIVFDEVIPSPYNSIITFSIIGFGLIFFLIGKKYISQPRLGKVKFGSTRIARKVKTIAVLTVNFFALLIIYLVGVLNPQFRLNLPGYLYGLLVGLLFFTLPLCFVAYFLQFKRLYFIAILLGLGFFLDEIFALLLIPEPFGSLLAFGLISITILSIGIVVFIRFLKNYPLPKEEFPQI